jgi:putative methionine-R-sulfoxide reductase with GAF domain
MRTAPHAGRDYASVLDRFGPETRLAPAHLREGRMREVVDALWEVVSARGVSWIGFYTKHPQRDEMTLGPRRDKPACSPLGLDGMCGRSWREHRPILLHDAAAVKGGYIACDPKDRSEVVVPLFEADGRCYGVLDADSYEIGTFDTADVIGLTTLVEHAGLSAPHEPKPAILRL